MSNRNNQVPLAHRVRPRNLDEFIGQEHLTGRNGLIDTVVKTGHVPSMIIYGPPGSGKTTLAMLIAEKVKAEFYRLSAVDSKVSDVRKVIDTARKNRAQERTTIIFIDEIHRFNKAQQDALLPAVESGIIILIGATTENPFFEVNAPLISRCMLITLNPLAEGDIERIIRRAIEHKSGYGGKLEITDEAVKKIISASGGDARRALNILEEAAVRGGNRVDADDVEAVLSAAVFYFDKKGDKHYDYTSAFIKSLRASDPDAALAYMTRMLEAGEDPKFIARRMIIFASEDVGNADPLALLVANAAFEAVEKVGMPECAINLSQAVTYLATAPKSNASYKALKMAQSDARKIPAITIPKAIRDSSYRGAKQLGHGKGYHYPHNYSGHFYPESLMPPELRGKTYYEPDDTGYEKKIRERLKYWRELINRAK